ncbi:hypothetical protein [Rhodoferax ferrireducens]|uniref:hypothetical protein n=1 Tax=Rhodoferax ferrireducens TaxID=192843 RepID=UPI0018E50CB7|nr:hypothetical protein [Rhodoferax ferrireducens]
MAASRQSELVASRAKPPTPSIERPSSGVQLAFAHNQSWSAFRTTPMEFIVGILLALAVSLSASFIGLDRDRAFYPTVLMVIASYYGLFAVMGGSMQTLAVESAAMLVFLAIASVGFKRNSWLVVVGLVAHAIFDFVHGHIVDNSGVPRWWPGFCLAYDATAGAYLAALLLLRAKTQKNASNPFIEKMPKRQRLLARPRVKRKR